MKKRLQYWPVSITLLIFIFSFMPVQAQKLSLELNPRSQPLKLGNKAWFSLKLTNDMEQPMQIFMSPMKEFGVGGYAYKVSHDGEVILERTTSGLDTNSKFRDNRVITLPVGNTKGILGLRQFELAKPGEYVIEVRYFQDPSNLNGKFAQNGKAKKKAKGITPYQAELTHKFTIE